MLKPREFLLIVQLSFTADWGVTLNLEGNRAHPEMIPPRFDLPLSPDSPDSAKWPTDPSESLSHNDTPETKITSNQQRDNERRNEIIVIMEEDPVVTESAVYLYERQAGASALLRYKKGALHVLRGGHLHPIHGNHDVILVGHGGTEGGSARLGGHSSEELAIFVSVLKTQNILGHLSTVSLIGCNLGNDVDFTLRLLRVLRSLGVETKLHMYNSLLSVSSDGKTMTSADGVWRSHDLGRRVAAELDHRGDLLTRVELGCAGPVFPDYEGHALYLQAFDWPRQPQMFVPMELRKKYPSIDCLEGLTWSLFFEESERRRAPDYVPYTQRRMEAVWLMEPGLKEQESIVFKHILTIQDLLVEIRYHAREEVTPGLFYVLNDCIYKVHSKSLRVTIVGKFMSADNAAEIDYFLQNFNRQQNESSLQELRLGLKASKFNDFCRQTFQYQQCTYNCERWGRYFMAAVFSASVRNFRTFSLFLMSVIGCEVGRSRGADSRLCEAFVEDDHPMVAEQPRPDRARRGFYGCAVDNYDMAPQNVQIWLDQVVSKENALYIRSEQIMTAVDHDEQTELAIFGKVKVMNKYVFSSYLEFFRGTPEGRKLKTGCTPTFQ